MKTLAQGVALIVALSAVALTADAQSSSTGIVPNDPVVTSETDAPAPVTERIDVSANVTPVAPDQMKLFFPLFTQNAARIHPEMKLVNCTDGRQYQFPAKTGNLTLGAQCTVEYGGKTVDVIACTDKNLGRFDYTMPNGSTRREDITALMFKSCYGG